MDAIGEGIKRLTWIIQGNAYYEEQVQSTNSTEAENIISDTPIEEGKVDKSNVEKIYFYPKEEIENDKWNSFLKSFGIFALVSALLLSIGLIPQFNGLIATASDGIATNWFGAILEDYYDLNFFWRYSTFEYASEAVFIVNMVSNGMGLAAFMVGLVIATPGKKTNKIWASVITILTVFPLHIFTLGFQKWATWGIANSTTFKIDHPLLYINFANIIYNLLPIIFWFAGFALLLFIYSKLEIKAFTQIWIWLHQIYYLFLKVVGLRRKPKVDEIFSEEAGTNTK